MCKFPEVAAQVGRGEIKLSEAEKIIKKPAATKPEPELNAKHLAFSRKHKPEPEPNEHEPEQAPEVNGRHRPRLSTK